MSITNTASQVSYTGNGVLVDFPTTFRFLEQEHLTVEVKESGEDEYVAQTLGVDYTVTDEDEDAGGTVTFDTAPANLSTVRITRSTPRTQETTFRNAGQSTFSPALHERALDKLTMISQEDDRRLDALESLGDLVDVTELANAVAFGDEVVASDPVEDTFPLDLTCADGDIATHVVWHVYAVDADDNPFDEPPVVDWIRGPTDKITIRRISGLRPGIAYQVTGLAFL